MVVNLSPEESHYFDTKMTLNFARKSKKIVNYVKVNETFGKNLSLLLGKFNLLVWFQDKFANVRIMCLLSRLLYFSSVRNWRIQFA